ncbi:predicted protein [Streptomyces viridochromogenes DSM 40736]|uniref:Predicted protein n=1 Tax=Streptomyces viridochromogenes (strain DSM 40736 / JCM 4977 / BCRC 1201 / Tue 494) TaxID=591159 RepID=D9XGZ0_STRVT|nr:hypothetical protein [Streptomyces viridochromogenes]EFL32783.1 predicted protein [Streptomyces viridochromogenes DSM 40736]
MSTPPNLTVLNTNRAPDNTHLVWDDARQELTDTNWADLPGASIPLQVGQNTPSYGALFVATFSAEAIVEHPENNAVANVTVFFGNDQAAPVSTNHRFVTARGGPEWSSHTLIRVVQFPVSLTTRNVTAQVKVKVGRANTTAGFQNWVLKVERYNL